MKKESSILNTKIGAIYIRVSTDKQEELSPDAQKRLLLDYAKSNNIDVPEQYIFMENGISGRHAGKRPEFQKMIGLAKSKDHPVDVILVWKFSRFARNQEESIVYKSLLKKNDVDVVSISEPLVDGPFGSLIERIIEWMDEYYSIRLSGEVLRGMSENAMRGNYQSEAPIGYTSPGNKELPVINPDTVIIPLTCKKMFLEENRTPLAIARHLNNSGYRTKRGNLFEARGVLYILENPFYAGKIRWNYTGRGRTLKDENEVIYADGKWEPLWSFEEYQLLKEKIDSRKAENANKTTRAKRDSASVKHWLSGMLRCSCCGRTLAYSGTQKAGYGFQCWAYAKGLCEESHYMGLKELEKHVIAGLENIMNQDTIDYEITHTSVSDDGRIIEINKMLEKLNVREQRIKDAYLNEIDSLEEYKENKIKLKNERDRLTRELSELNTVEDFNKSELDNRMYHNLAETLDVLKDDAATAEEKSLALRSIVDKIVFDRKNTSFDFHLKLLF